MVSKLVFKGDKVKKRKQDHSQKEGLDQDKIKKSQKVSRKYGHITQEEENKWVLAKSLDDLNGPCMIVKDGEEPCCMACDGSGKMYSAPISTFEPTNVQQVFVLGNIVQSDSRTLKSYAGKLVSISKYGICEAKLEAIGPEQEIKIERHLLDDDRWVIRSIWDKYLTIKSKDVRGDTDDVNENEIFTIRVQSKYRKREIKLDDDSDRIIHTNELERLVGDSLSREDAKWLKKAFKGKYVGV
ncbi:hypothetical protein V1514DRAFT_332774 [Lipomyces japonicus]|uniref:uncharacterized protein n=1 Tax=Lipomyces japonicus TaxID=56871 RepID=UPI0034CEB181